MQHAHQDKESSCHECGYAKAAHAVLLDDTVNDNDESSGRTANLNLAASKEGDDETCNDCSQNTGLRSCSRCNTERDGKRQSHNTYNYTCKQVLNKCLFVVTVLES